MNKQKKNNIYVNIIRYVVLSLVLVGSVFGTNNVYATETASPTDSTTESTTESITEDTDSQQYYDVSDSVVEVRVIYEDKTGQQHVIKSGNGFYIGYKDAQIYIVCGRDSLYLTQEEKATLMTTYEIEGETINTIIQFKVEPDIFFEAEIKVDSVELGIMILNPMEELEDVTTLMLCEDAYANKTGDVVRVLGKLENNESYWEEATLVDWYSVGAQHYYFHDCPITKANYGCPVINNENQVIGVNLYSNGTYNYVLQIQDIISVCNDLGIEYNPAITVEIESLTSIMEEYSNIDVSNYTDESVSVCEQLCQDAQMLLDSIENGEVDYSTQGKVDEFATLITQAIEDLQEKSISQRTIITIAIIVGAILLLCILVLVIVMLCAKSKYKKLLEKERLNTVTAKEALQQSGRITPGKKENRLTANMPLNRSLTTMAVDNQFVPSETSVLSIDDMLVSNNYTGKIQNNAYLVRRRTGEEVLINKNTFIIGKDTDVVDFYIPYNSNISRQHACISQIGGNYYIKDMGTTNGTYVNGFKLDGKNDTMLQDGSVIVIADEEFEFRK